MQKKYLFICLVISVITPFLPMFAQEKGGEAPGVSATPNPEPVVKIEFTNEFVSNYIDRGEDMFANYAVQKSIPYGSATGAWAYQPALKFNFLRVGLYFEIFGSFAMAGRNDRDIDGVYQTGPGGDDLLAESGSLSEQITALQEAMVPETDPNLKVLCDYIQSKGDPLPSECSGTMADTAIPGRYKEENGLKRTDKLIFTFGMERETKLGTIGFGLTSDSLANTIGKEAPTTEIFFTYSPHFLDILGFEAVLDTANSEMYYNLSLSPKVEIAKDIELGFTGAVGYNVTERLQGVRDVVASITLGVRGFTIGVNAAYRPDFRFFDEDGDNRGLPVWLDGGSNNSDGLVTDPSLTNGVINTFFNSEMTNLLNPGNPNFTYTPRQKLPRVVYWANVGYTIELE